jgi:DNA polymerase I-like protein with 3'-5' exonuclease and polymerase domains
MKSFKVFGVPCEFIEHHDRASIALSALLNSKAPFFGIDIETTGFSPRTDAISLIQIFDGKTCYVFDYFSIEGESDCFDTSLKQLLSAKKFSAFNALFELSWFQHYFGLLNIDMGCSYVMSRLYSFATDEKAEFEKGSLQEYAKKYLGLELDKSEQKSDWSIRPLTENQIKYAAADAIVCKWLIEKLSPLVHELDLSQEYLLNKKVLNAVAQVQNNGQYFNSEEHSKMIEQWNAELDKQKKIIKKLIPVENIRSKVQLGEWINKTIDVKKLDWPLTPKGRLKIDKDVLTRYEKAHLAFTELVKFNKIEKLRSTYGEKFRDFICPVTSRIHSNYTLARTITFRTSSYEPNLQNQPNGAGFRSLFIPEEGRKLIVADYNQIELRILAHVSGDRVLLNNFKNGVDNHRWMASIINGKPEEQVTKAERDKAKAVNFGFAFGMGPEKFITYARASYGVDYELEEAREAREIWRRALPGVWEWQQEEQKRCRQELTTRTVLGFTRKLTKDRYYTTGLNTPVQGTASELFKLACYKFTQRSNNYNDITAMLTNMVHDEFVVEVDEIWAEMVRGDLIQDMTEAMVDIFPNCSKHGLVEARIVDNWGEKK